LTETVPYKIAIYTSLNVLLGTYDNLTGINPTQTVQTAAGTPLTASGYTTATNVQTAFNDLGASTGSSKVGFLQSGSGAVGMPAQTKMRQAVNMEDYIPVGTGGTQAGDSAALKAAIIYAATNWLPVILPARRIYWDGTAITADKVKLWGGGMPTVNTGRTTLVGGTIIEGTITCTGSYIDLRDFGVDLGTATSAPDNNGIKCTPATFDGGVSLHTENIIALAKTKTSAIHALLFEGYQRVSGGNISGINGYFGCVIKCRNVQLTSINTDNNFETGVYIKSDNVYGQASNIQISQIRTKNADSYGTRIQADSNPNADVQIGTIYGEAHANTLFVQTIDPGPTARQIAVGSIISKSSTNACVLIYSLAASGSIDAVSIGSLISINPAVKVINIIAEATSRVGSVAFDRVYASYAAGTSQATMDGAVFVGARCASASFQDIQLVENYGVGTKIGGIAISNSPGAFFVGYRIANVVGGETPGYNAQTLSGTAAALLIVRNSANQSKSSNQITIAANTTINTFGPLVAGTTFEYGYVLFVVNNSNFNLTINNNVGGGILNKTGAAIVLTSNQVAQYISNSGGVWFQV
jgi:hypothetical protein